jgi:hypothetical protein
MYRVAQKHISITFYVTFCLGPYISLVQQMSHSNIWTKSEPVIQHCFFPDNMILVFFRLNVKVKVDLLKLTLKLIFFPKYFQILSKKNQNPFIWKTLKFGRETIVADSSVQL